jgi:hypothetical protein
MDANKAPMRKRTDGAYEHAIVVIRKNHTYV